MPRLDEAVATMARHELAFEDRRIRYLRQEHHGLLHIAHTYNAALAMAQGSLIAILEGDDLWSENKLAVLVPEFADPRVVLAYSRTGVLNEWTNRRELYPDAGIERDSRYQRAQKDREDIAAAKRGSRESDASKGPLSRHHEPRVAHAA